MWMPVITYSEPNAVRSHAKELSALGKKALIVTGANSAVLCGAFKDVTDALKEYRIPYVLYNKIEQNPSVETVLTAAAFGQQEQVDYVIGVGGGSPLDAAKAIAWVLCHPEADSAALYTPGNNTHLPVALVPTTCGTGSEVTPISVLTRTELRTKKSISHPVFANLALIDGAYLTKAPLSVLRSTALDALTHLWESALNRRSDDFSRMAVDAGLRLWTAEKDCLQEGTEDPVRLQKMMNASAMAGIAIAQTSTTLPHGFSYSLTVEMQVPHGKAVGYFAAGYLAEAEENIRKELLQKAGFYDLQDYRQWYGRLYDVPDVPDSLLEQATEAIWNNPQKLQTAPFEVNLPMLRRMVFDMKWHSPKC